MLPLEFPAVAASEAMLALQRTTHEVGAPHHWGIVWTRAAFQPGLLPLFSYNGAGLTARRAGAGERERQGSLEVGKRADLIVRDLTMTALDEETVIADLEALLSTGPIMSLRHRMSCTRS